MKYSASPFSHTFPAKVAPTSNMFLRDSKQTRPSVPGMRSLKPLTLLSPPLPSGWPLSNSAQAAPNTAVVPPSSTRKESLENYQRWRNRANTLPSNQYRDIPIYNEPTSAPPAEVYFIENGLGMGSRPPFIDDEKPTTEVQPDQSENYPVFEDPNPDEVDEISGVSYVQSSRRDSELSFQCSGETSIPSEAEWLKSSSRKAILPWTNLPESLENSIVDDSLESWLSDSSSDQEDELLAFATALKPTKASLVEFSSPLSASSRTRIASTASYYSQLSLPLPGTPPRRSKQLGETPPISPDKDEDSKEATNKSKDHRKTDRHLPRRRLDLAMSSPPVSPDDFPEPPKFKIPSPLRDAEPGMAVGSSSIVPPSKFDWLLPSPKPEGDIMASLEDSIATFPYTMLDLHSPVVEDIRLYSLINDGKLLGFHAAPNSFFPELEPFCRVFPGSSPAQQSALYAHILAHLHIEFRLESGQTPSLLETRRHTPFWPTSPSKDTGSSTFASIEGQPPTIESTSHKSTRRLRGLQKDVRRCIQSLVLKMEDPTEDIDDKVENKVNGTVLKMLEEIVRSSESRIFGCI